MKIIVYFSPSLNDHSGGNLEFRPLGISNPIEAVFSEVEELSADG